MVEKHISMIDYETLTYPKGGRLLGFGGMLGGGAIMAFGIWASLKTLRA